MKSISKDEMMNVNGGGVFGLVKHVIKYLSKNRKKASAAAGAASETDDAN